MSQNQALIAEIKMEAASTDKMLKQVPLDNSTWKPHAKSMAVGNLATHIAELPGWITMVLGTDGFDLATMNYKPQIPTSTDALVALHNEKVNEGVAALENATDADLGKMWSLSKGGHVMFTLPKNVVIRSFALSHSYHHRGQLSVYLRLLDVHVPGMYGPTADEMILQAAKETAAAN